LLSVFIFYGLEFAEDCEPHLNSLFEQATTQLLTGHFMKFYKWKLAASCADGLGQPLPQRPDFVKNEEKPVVMGGKFYAFFQKQKRVLRSPPCVDEFRNALGFFHSLFQAKAGLPRPTKQECDEENAKYASTMSKPEPDDESITVPRFFGKEEGYSEKLTLADCEKSVRRVVRDLFRRNGSKVKRRMKEMCMKMPSESAHFSEEPCFNTRKMGGAVLPIVSELRARIDAHLQEEKPADELRLDRVVNAPACEANMKRYLSQMSLSHEVPRLRLFCELSDVLSPYLIVGAVDFCRFMKLSVRKNKKGKTVRKEEMTWCTTNRPVLSLILEYCDVPYVQNEDHLKLVENEDSIDQAMPIRVHDDGIQKVIRKLVTQDVAYDQADEECFAEGMTLAEALKMRGISKGSPLPYAVANALQPLLFSLLSEQKWFANDRPVTGSLIRERLPPLKSGQKWKSADFKGATNNLRSRLSRACAEEFADCLGLDEASKRILVTTLINHSIYDRETKTYFQQRRGQLMGSPTSFPVLCIVNLALVSLGLDRGIEDIDCLVNGDDLLVAMYPHEEKVWARVTQLGGLEESVGKSPEMRAVGMAVARVEIDYLREIQYPGRVRIGTCVARLGRSSITVEQALFQDETCFATSRGVMVMLDRETRRPAEMPAALRAGFAALAPISEAG